MPPSENLWVVYGCSLLGAKFDSAINGIGKLLFRRFSIEADKELRPRRGLFYGSAIEPPLAL